VVRLGWEAAGLCGVPFQSCRLGFRRAQENPGKKAELTARVFLRVRFIRLSLRGPTIPLIAGFLARGRNGVIRLLV
jgi:hypothetical protein